MHLYKAVAKHVGTAAPLGFVAASSKKEALKVCEARWGSVPGYVNAEYTLAYQVEVDPVIPLEDAHRYIQAVWAVVDGVLVNYVSSRRAAREPA